MVEFQHSLDEGEVYINRRVFNKKERRLFKLYCVLSLLYAILFPLIGFHMLYVCYRMVTVLKSKHHIQYKLHRWAMLKITLIYVGFLIFAGIYYIQSYIYYLSRN